MLTSTSETKYGMGYHLWDITIAKFNIYLKVRKLAYHFWAS